MPGKKSSNRKKVNPSARSRENAGVTVGNITRIRGNINVAGRDIINKKIKIIYERALTAAEEAEKARAIELKLLAEGIGHYVSNLKDRLDDNSDVSIPYRGLLEYRLSDAEHFFGRDDAKKQIGRILSQSAFSVLYAESGAGKTSLLQAGIMPALLAAGHLPIYLRPYDKNPSDAIKRMLLRDSEYATVLLKESLVDFLRRVTTILGARTTLILIVDQFEEFFFPRLPETDRKAFIDDLTTCVNNPSLNVRWLLCLRKEYFSDLNMFRPGIANPFENAFHLEAMSRAEAEAAITGPAKLQKLSFENGLIPELLDDLGKEQILPPHIQLVCSALAGNLPGRQNVFRRADYVKLGRAQGILKNHLDRVLAEKVPKNRIAVCQQLLQGLVTSTQQRVLRTEQDLCTALGNYPQDEVRDAISLLARNRLLRGEETDEGPAYELAHDILLEEIKLNPEIVKRKQAEELLEQGLKNWKRFGITLNSGILAIIAGQKEELHFTSDRISLLLLSLMEAGKPGKEWRYYLSVARQKNLSRDIANTIASLVSHPDKGTSTNASKVLWHFLRDCPAPVRPKIILRNLRYRIPIVLRQAVFIGLVATLIYQLAWIISRAYLERIGWEAVSSLAPDCLASIPSEAPSLTVDTADASRIIAFGRTQSYICQSLDAGDSWASISKGLPSAVTIRSVAVYKGLRVLISPDEVFFWDGQTDAWVSSRLNMKRGVEFQGLSIGRKSGMIYLGFSPHEIISIQTTGRCRTTLEEEFDPTSITGNECIKRLDTGALIGKINFLETNEKYIVVNTDAGTWFSPLDEINWKERPGLNQPILSFKLQPQSFLDNGVFIVIFPDQAVQWGELERSTLETTNLWPFPSTNGDDEWDWPEKALYATASDYVFFASTSTEIQRYPGWTIFDREWWRLIREDLANP